MSSSIKSEQINARDIRRELTKKVNLMSFISNRVYSDGGWAGFIHWIESMLKYDRLIVPISFTGATAFRIAVSDDGINYRQVYKGGNTNENYALWVKDRGDLALLSTGSSGANTVGSVYRSTDGGETWSKILDSVNYRVYPLEFTAPTGYALAGTTNGLAETATAGTIHRSGNISGAATWTTVLSVGEGIRSIKSLSTGTVLAGSGTATGSGIYRSADEGATWTLVKRFTAAEAKAIYWIQEEPEGAVYACDVGGNVFESLDDGRTWTFKFKVKSSISQKPVIRRATKFGTYTLASIDLLGLCVISFKDGIVLPLLSETTNAQIYNVCKFKGGAVLSFADRIGYSGSVGRLQPAIMPLWSAKAVTTADATTQITSHFSLLGKQKSTVYLYSDKSGDLYLRGFDEAAGNTFRRISGETVAVNATTLTKYNLADLRGRMFQVEFVPSADASVNCWVVTE